MLSENTTKKLKETADIFQNKKPFKSVVVDNFFSDEVVDEMIRYFPKPNFGEMRNEYGGASLKHAVADVASISASYYRLDQFIKSKTFLDYMQLVTGIEGLIYDPSYYGGGTHNNLSGQGMDVHVDFNLLEIPGIGTLHRRVNAIIYLNERWEEEWGGNLELHSDPYDPENDQVEKIIPLKNRMVLFETNEMSWHGFRPVSDKIPKEISRKSFAIYLYSKDRPADEIVPNHGTFYVPRFDLESPVNIPQFKQQRTHCLNMIRELYNNEKRLSQVIADRQYDINNLKKLLPSSLYDKNEKQGSRLNVEISEWGPDTFERQALPNVQPDGSVGFWAKIKQITELINPCLLVNEESMLDIVIEGELVTAAIPATLFVNAEFVNITLIDQLSGFARPIGKITQTP